jgi:hypothetical protein
VLLLYTLIIIFYKDEIALKQVLINVNALIIILRLFNVLSLSFIIYILNKDIISVFKLI